MNSKSYLRFLQDSIDSSPEAIEFYKNALSGWGKKRSEQLADGAGAAFYEDVDKLEKSPIQMQTDFVNEQILPFLLKCIPPDWRSKLDSTIVGVLPTRNFNASVTKFADLDPIILLDVGVFNICHFYQEAKSTLSAYYSQQRVDEGSEYLYSAYQFIISYYKKHGKLSVPYPPDNLKIPHQLLTIATAKAVAMELFLLAHEVAHVISGDLDDKTSEKRTVPLEGSENSVDLYQKSELQEFRADALGYKMYLMTCNSMDLLECLNPIDRYLVPFELFEVLNLLENNRAITNDYSVHPPSSHRVANLVLVAEKMTKEQAIIEATKRAANRAIKMPDLDAVKLL